MNDLSWLIYGASVADDINAVCGIAIFGLVIFCAGYTILGSIENEEFTTHKPSLLLLAALAAVGTIVPSRDTLYAIAISEMGEEVVKSETAGKAVQALNAWLDRQIKPDQGDVK